MAMGICKNCKQEYINGSHAKTIYCSRICMYTDKDWIDKQSKAKMGKEAWNKGKPAPWARYELLLEPASRRKMAEAKRGKPSPNKGKVYLNMRGENSPHWRGGRGTERHQAMGKVEYRIWREAVFARDNWTCVVCYTRGGKLEADHIKPWVLYPELRYAIDNGRTLCISCHRKTETWGRRVLSVERLRA